MPTGAGNFEPSFLKSRKGLVRAFFAPHGCHVTFVKSSSLVLLFSNMATEEAYGSEMEAPPASHVEDLKKTASLKLCRDDAGLNGSVLEEKEGM